MAIAVCLHQTQRQAGQKMRRLFGALSNAGFDTTRLSGPRCPVHHRGTLHSSCQAVCLSPLLLACTGMGKNKPFLS